MDWDGSVGVQEVIPGTGAIFLPKIKSWAVNNVKRYEDIFYDDDGFLSRGDNDEGIKFTSFYAPRGLRKILKSRNSDGSFFRIIAKISYIPSKLCLINKKWYTAFLYSKCRVCNTGKYDIITGKCINCCHVLNGNKKRRLVKN